MNVGDEQALAVDHELGGARVKIGLANLLKC